MKNKSILDFSQKGFALLDKKRTVLIQEMMGMIDRAKAIEDKIERAYEEAYTALQEASITLGVQRLEELALGMNLEEEYEVIFRSVMGVEIPEILLEKEKKVPPQYGFYYSNPAIDIAIQRWNRAKRLSYELAMLEDSAHKLSLEIKKTQKRANALEKIHIPHLKERIKTIEQVLEEKEREDFFRLKVVKKKQQQKK